MAPSIKGLQKWPNTHSTPRKQPHQPQGWGARNAYGPRSRGLRGVMGRTMRPIFKLHPSLWQDCRLAEPRPSKHGIRTKPPTPPPPPTLNVRMPQRGGEVAQGSLLTCCRPTITESLASMQRNRSTSSADTAPAQYTQNVAGSRRSYPLPSP